MSPRSCGVVSALTVALLSASTVGQNPIRQLNGDAPGDQFGVAVAGVGDVNLDGWPDVLIGAPSGNRSVQNAGYAVVFSGRNGAPLRSFAGTSVGENLGRRVAAAGDVDRDGHPDLLIQGASGLQVIASQDWSTIRTVAAVTGAFAAAGDVDNDGHDDLIAMTAAETVEVFSGRTGATLHRFTGVFGDEFGAAVGGAGDVDRDGHDDVIVGAPGRPFTLASGFARVFSGRTGTQLFEFGGVVTGDSFGSTVSGAGDVNRDGHDDFIIGARQDSVDAFRTSGGYAVVYSGSDGSVLAGYSGVCPLMLCRFRLLERFAEDAAGPAGDLDGDGNADYFIGKSLFSGREHRWLRIALGSKPIAAIGDADKDGVDDVVVGDAAANRATIVSGLDRRLLRTDEGSDLGEEVRATTGLSDLDDDGHEEYLIAFSGNRIGGQGLASPSVVVYSGATGDVVRRIAKPRDAWGQMPPVSIAAAGAGDVDNDGTPDFVVGWRAPSQPLRLSQVEVYSGADFSVIHVLPWPLGILGYPTDVAGGVRWNADDNDDWAVSSFDGGTDNGGFVEVRSGADKSILATFDGDSAGDRFGASFAFLVDTDRDNAPDLLVGAPGDDDAGDGAGSARLISGATGTVLYTLHGWAAGDAYGSSVAAAGDIDADGSTDFAVGAPGWSGGRGLVEVVSGATGRVLFVVRGATADAALGTAVDAGRDADRDGVPDVLIGSPGTDTVLLVSGRDGSTVETYTDPDFGSVLALGGDLTDDGYGEVLCASTLSYLDSFRPDYVKVYRLAETGSYSTFGRGCAGGALGRPRLTRDGGTAPGDSVTLEMDRVRARSMGVLHFGFSTERLGLLALPSPLGFVGMTGCVQLVSMDVDFPLAGDGTNEITFTLTIPDDPALNGAEVFQQYTHVDLDANPLGLVNTNAARLVVGPR